MKTFKLKQLQIVEFDTDAYKTVHIPLFDGLIINREDVENRWLIEAYTNPELLDYFTALKENNSELIIHVKITTESNELATCITSIIDINPIGDNINVLLLGTMVDQKTEKIEKVLEKLVTEGNRGEDLLNKFKENL
ncbi:YwpF-like family protein [Oceanobacillus alkalisoli]|uniref:YwpF-like family protein n=1 Tax=Oceanobacillus alkalisoli TaxID=2925113 RepID=UPI001F122427|nr:YwpF-like family protein [Oceanobacillus alkalisoli]MCF3944755.1 YwpF-like family protein [Oceanobacillus alkalisoli]